MLDANLDASLTERLGGRWAVSWQALVIMLPVAVGVIALGAQTVGDVLTWFVIALMAVGVSASWSYVMHRTVFRDRALQPVAFSWVIAMPIIHASLYVGIAVVLGLLLGVLDANSALSHFLPLWVITVFAGGLLTLVLDSQWRFRVQREELIRQAVQQQLATAQELEVLREIRKSVGTEVDEQVKTSSAALIRRIDAIVKSGEADGGVLAGELRNTADRTVRALSHQLEKRALRTHRTPGFLPALANVFRYQPFRPVAVSIVYLITATPREVNLHGWAIGLGLLVLTVAFIFAIMLPLNQALKRWPEHHVSIYLIGLVIIQAPTVLVSPLREQVTGESFTALDLVLTTLIGTFIVVATSSFGSWNRTRKDVIADFQREVNADTIATLARGEALAKATMDVALVLHGSVQSSLYACALKIEEASRQGDIVEVNGALMQARAILEQPELERGARDSESLSQAVSRPITQWAGLLAVDVDVDPAAEEIAAGRETHVADIVEEAIANAVHHGSASEVSVQIGCLGEDLIITVRDNGKGPRGGTPGLGGRLYSQWGAQWSLTAGDQGAILSLRLQPVPETTRTWA